MKAAERFFSFLMGFFIYSLIEIAARGYTHWTMALTGGLVLSILYDINSRDAVSLFKSCIAYITTAKRNCFFFSAKCYLIFISGAM